VKKYIIIISCLFTFQGLQAQSIFDSTSCCNNFYTSAFLDTLYTLCDSVQNPKLNINIEATTNNIWQKGATTKFGISNLRDTSCSIYTDTSISYAINNTSAFNFLLPNNTFNWGSPGGMYNYYFKFWHKFETDSLYDGCWLEFSSDSGLTWNKIDSNFGFDGVFEYCNLYHRSSNQIQNFDTLMDGTKAWSGNSNSWIETSLWLNPMFPIKPNRSFSINAIRFVFQSDSIQTNKPGWIIDDVYSGHVFVAGRINDIQKIKKQLPIYPNPSSNGRFTVSYPSHYVKGVMQVFNMLGQKIIEKPLSKEIDLSNSPNGFYFYKTSFDGVTYSGMLQKN
jgi:hypothetical protein